MKTIGMIGGMSWESTSVYYQLLNREILKRTNGTHAAKALLYSFDFGEMSALQQAGKWREADDRMATAAVTLEKAGADFLIICCNTMHCSTPAIESAARIPLLHIADPLGGAIRAAGRGNPALLGSSHTMEREDIIMGRLREKFGLAILTPEHADRETVDRTITEELVHGRFEIAARQAFGSIIARLAARGADSVIMGCTEIPLLLKPEDSTLPLFDTLTLHALAAVDYALG